jgi:hypothetical protein
MISIDFLRGVNGDLLEDPDTLDFVEGESDGQHIEDCMLTEPGTLAHNIMAGVGLEKQINGAVDGKVRREMQLQLEADGYRVDKIVFTGDIIDINAEREG